MPVAMWMRRLAIAGVLLCFVVVVLGAYVRLTAAGLGCPDWPGCYGHLSPVGAAHSADIEDAFPDRPLEVGKAWREMLHRYAVGTLSCLILALAVLAVRDPPAAPGERAAGAGTGGDSHRAGAAGHAHRHLAAEPAHRHRAPGLRHDDTCAAVVAHPVAARQQLGDGGDGQCRPVQPRGGGGSPLATGRRLALVGLAALIVQIVLGLDQQQLRRCRLPGFSDLPGCAVAARRLRARLRALARPDQLRGRRARQPGARGRSTSRTGWGALVATAALTIASLYVLRRRGLVARAAAGLGGAGGAWAAAAHRHVHGAEELSAVARHRAHRGRRVALAGYARAPSIPERALISGYAAGSCSTSHPGNTSTAG